MLPIHPQRLGQQADIPARQHQLPKHPASHLHLGGRAVNGETGRRKTTFPTREGTPTACPYNGLTIRCGTNRVGSRRLARQIISSAHVLSNLSPSLSVMSHFSVAGAA